MQEFSLEWFASLVLLVLPAYFANAAPVYINNAEKIRRRVYAPIDGGMNFIDGKRVLGDGKTWEGLVGGICAGWLSGAVLGLLGMVPLGMGFDRWFAVSVFLSVGALFGDLAGSFLKRRLSVERGVPFPFFDQLGFVVFSLAFASAAAPELGYMVGASGFFVLLFLSYGAHKFFNWLAWKAGLKSVQW